MPTDFELLKLAAKAAGYEINFDEPAGSPIDYYPHGYDDNGDVAEWWNPLHDDGNALRLLVALPGFKFRRDNVAVHVDFPAPVDGCVGVLEWHDGSDLQTAMRRAIVRAYAEVGDLL